MKQIKTATEKIHGASCIFDAVFEDIFDHEKMPKHANVNVSPEIHKQNLKKRGMGRQGWGQRTFETFHFLAVAGLPYVLAACQYIEQFPKENCC